MQRHTIRLSSCSLPVDTQMLLGNGDLYELLVTHTAVTCGKL